MTLVSKEMPPGGYTYVDTRIGFNVPYGSDLATQGLTFVAKALQTARANNPDVGLDPTWEACLAEVGRYTCERFANDPRLLSEFCREAVPQAPSTQSAAVGRKSGGCRSCGKR